MQFWRSTWAATKERRDVVSPLTDQDIWIVGSSIIKQAFCHARQIGMVNLCLPVNAHVWWQGYGGMKLNGRIPKIKLLLAINKTKPDIVIVHVGGNDIGRRPILDVMREYKKLSMNYSLCSQELKWVGHK